MAAAAASAAALSTMAKIQAPSSTKHINQIQDKAFSAQKHQQHFQKLKVRHAVTHTFLSTGTIVVLLSLETQLLALALASPLRPGSLPQSGTSLVIFINMYLFYSSKPLTHLH